MAKSVCLQLGSVPNATEAESFKELMKTASFTFIFLWTARWDFRYSRVDLLIFPSVKDR
jgi:hypothetical protein